MNEPTLFDLATLPAKCPVCGATNNGERADECGVDLSRAAGEWLKRPVECLNTPRPETEPIPY